MLQVVRKVRKDTGDDDFVFDKVVKVVVAKYDEGRGKGLEFNSKLE